MQKIKHPSGFNFKRLDGKKFGRLYVRDYHGKNIHGIATWLCECDCGEIAIVPQGSLTNGFTKSCGCYGKEFPSHTIHGGKGDRLYYIWKSMRERCNTTTSTSYSKYGNRGIIICSEWNDYSVFRDWSYENGYSKQLTIDRIDNDGNYCPENCRWATWKQQARNTRRTRYYVFDGIKKPFIEWCEELGCDYRRSIQRLNRGQFPFYNIKSDL